MQAPYPEMNHSEVKHVLKKALSRSSAGKTILTAFALPNKDIRNVFRNLQIDLAFVVFLCAD